MRIRRSWIMRLKAKRDQHVGAVTEKEHVSQAAK